MKQVLFILTIFLSSLSFGQDKTNWTELDDLNSGTAVPFYTESDINGVCFIVLSDTFDNYRHPIVINDKKRNEVLRIEYNDKIGFITTYKGIKHLRSDTLTSMFCPWYYLDKDSYFGLVFDCIDTIGDYYKVWFNNSEFGFIRKHDMTFKKKDISEYIKESALNGLTFIRAENPLKELPDNNSKTITSPDQDKYKIWAGESIDIKGDWLKIKTVRNEIGWIKWKEGKKVLIGIYHT